MATVEEIKKAFEHMKKDMAKEINTRFGKFVMGASQIEKRTGTRWLFPASSHTREEAEKVAADMEATKAFEEFQTAVGECTLTVELQQDGFWCVRFHY